MTKSVGVHEAKTHLSKLLQLVAAGEEVAITLRGDEVARLVPAQPSGVRRFGLDQGVWTVPEEFDAPLPDETLAALER